METPSTHAPVPLFFQHLGIETTLAPRLQVYSIASVAQMAATAILLAHLVHLVLLAHLAHLVLLAHQAHLVCATTITLGNQKYTLAKLASVAARPRCPAMP